MKNIKIIFKDTKSIINEKIHLILFLLFKTIFLQDIKDIEEEGLDNYLNIINKNIIKNRNKYINKKYTKENFKNIIDFTKGQNKIFAGEILEEILIIIFNFTLNIKINNLEENILGCLSEKIEILNYDISKFVDTKKLKPNELNDIKNILIKEDYEKENIDKVVLYQLLKNISNIKLEQINSKINYQKKCDKLLGNSFHDLIDNNNKNYSTNISSKLFSNDKFSLIKQFLIKVLIYNQNKQYSYLMNYTNKEKQEDIVNVPFIYNLNESRLNENFASIILKPSRIDSRINQLILTKNAFRENGILELSKVILFNKNIKIIDYDKSSIKSYYLKFLNLGLGIFDNYTIEDLNLSFNHLKNDCIDYLATLISHLKGLKTINLSSNKLENGLSFFFTILKELYRKNKTKLENLYLNDCFIDDISFYELGQLLKSKYCKLKKLYLNGNLIPFKNNFFNKLKKNNSLTEIYLNNSNINNNDIDNINKIISNTGIQHLYLYNNNINNFAHLLKIIYRTKLIKKDFEKNFIISEPTLLNLDLSKNEIIIKNTNLINLLINIIKETNLSCLDISKILYNENPKEIFLNINNNEYIKKIDGLKEILEKNKNKYIKIAKELNSLNVDIKNYKNLETIFNDIEGIEEVISNIIMNENAKYPPFLKREIRKILDNKNYKNKFDKICKDYKINRSDIQETFEKYMIYRRAKYNCDIINRESKSEKLFII